MYVSRRGLIACAGAVALCGGVNAAASVAPRGSFREKERDIPLDDWADVIVAGGGPAGIAAAVSAARAGKKVRLFELQGCLGGVWTAGLLSYVFDFDKSEIGWEIIRRLDALGARRLDSGVKYDLDRDWVSEATMRSRREIVALAAALEKLGGPWKGFRVIGTAEQIGHRDARRIHGHYTVTREDIENGTTFDDVCTISRFGIDIHGIDKKMNDGKAAGNSGGVKFRPFQIPLRSCIAKDADNLYMAGRNISGDFYAHASYRVTGSSVALGEAVGKAAAGVFKPCGIVAPT